MRATADDKVWYFAYGSNMNQAQMRRRIGTIGTGDDRPRVACLADYRLAFNKLGQSGVVYANIMP